MISSLHLAAHGVYGTQTVKHEQEREQKNPEGNIMRGTAAVIFHYTVFFFSHLRVKTQKPSFFFQCLLQNLIFINKKSVSIL